MDICTVGEEVFESENTTTDNSTTNNTISTNHIEVNFEGIYSTIAIDTTTATTFGLYN